MGTLHGLNLSLSFSGLSSSMAHTSGYMSMSNTAHTKTSPVKKPREREPLKPIQNEMAPPMEVDIKVAPKEPSPPKPPPKVKSPVKNAVKQPSPVPNPPKSELTKNSSPQVFIKIYILLIL